MNLTINKVQPTNYINNQLKNNKDEKFKLEVDDKQITEEEDKELYELYKKSHMAHFSCDFEGFKKIVITFPPVTAPGIVRKAWRQQWEKATEQQKHAMRWIASDCLYSLEKNGNVPKDLNSYLDFMGEIKGCVEQYNGSPGVNEGFYQCLVDVTNNFETELKKYKF